MPDYEAIAAQYGKIASHLVARDDEDKCHPQPNIDLCEKPASANVSTPITIGVIVGVIVLGTIALLTWFHVRRRRRDEQEWPKNNQELDDYGFTAPSNSVRQPQAAHHPQSQQQHVDEYERSNVHHDAGFASQKSARGSLDNLERSLRGGQGQTTGAFQRKEEQISADMRPVQPSDRI